VMINQEEIDVLATLEVTDVHQLLEAEVIEDLAIEVLVTAEKDVMMILKVIDAQNLVALDLIDRDVLDEEINLLQSSIF
jgi:hypothetical protein